MRVAAKVDYALRAPLELAAAEGDASACVRHVVNTHFSS
jgi:hypothetical protein